MSKGFLGFLQITLLIIGFIFLVIFAIEKDLHAGIFSIIMFQIGLVKIN